MPTIYDEFDIVLIGAGPRGLILLEQLASELHSRRQSERSAEQTLRVAVCDPAPFGAGAVWDPHQSEVLLMNVQARRISIYQHSAPERTSHPNAGPTLDRWIRDVKGSEGLEETDQYAPRPVFGEYLADAYRRLIDQAGSTLDVNEFKAEAIDLTPLGDCWAVRVVSEMAGAPQHIRGKTVVLATGHIPSEPDELQRARLCHSRRVTRDRRPCHYIGAGLHRGEHFNDVGSDDAVYLEGLGLGFFDVVALLTEERGGRWKEDQYCSSGNEPLLLAGSRRGLPFLGRSRMFKARPEISERLERVFEGLGWVSSASFGEVLWPEIERALRHEVTEAVHELWLVSGVDQSLVERTEALVNEPFENWSHANSLTRVMDAGTHHDRIMLFLQDQVELEKASCAYGKTLDPRQRAAEYLQPVRDRIRSLVPGLRFSAASYANDLEAQFSSFAGFINVGPPMLRVEQLISLEHAGLLRFTGPAGIAYGSEGFTVETSDGYETVNALVEARVPSLAVDKSARPLLRNLVRSGVAGLNVRDGINFHGVAVSVPDGRIKDREGNVQTGLFAYGVPTEGTYWNTVGGLAGEGELLVANHVARAILGELNGSMLTSST